MYWMEGDTQPQRGFKFSSYERRNSCVTYSELN